MTRHALLFFCALLLPLSAYADDANCRHSQPRQLDLDLDGVRSVRFDIGHNRLRLDAAPGTPGVLQGRACASGESWLEHLKVEQRRDGDRLHVRLHRDGTMPGSFLRRTYAYLDIAGSVPDDVLVQLVVGSGDAWITGASALSADVGSGDVQARRISGAVTAKVGSGDIELEDIGSLNVLAIGSGDIEAANVRGEVEVGAIGSGDLVVRGVGGSARIGSIGSGDATLSDVRGNVAIGSLGSGDVGLRGVGGNVTIDSLGSGDIDVRRISGAFTVSTRASGSVHQADVAGDVHVPER